MVQTFGKNCRGTLPTGRCSSYQVQCILGDGVFHVFHWLWIDLLWGWKGGWGRIDLNSDLICLFMKMRKQKNANGKILLNEGNNHPLKVSKKYKILHISGNKRKF